MTSRQWPAQITLANPSRTARIPVNRAHSRSLSKCAIHLLRVRNGHYAVEKLTESVRWNGNGASPVAQNTDISIGWQGGPNEESFIDGIAACDHRAWVVGTDDRCRRPGATECAGDPRRHAY